MSGFHIFSRKYNDLTSFYAETAIALAGFICCKNMPSRMIAQIGFANKVSIRALRRVFYQAYIIFSIKQLLGATYFEIR